jgi:hypothetical protein
METFGRSSLDLGSMVHSIRLHFFTLGFRDRESAPRRLEPTEEGSMNLLFTCSLVPGFLEYVVRMSDRQVSV